LQFNLTKRYANGLRVYAEFQPRYGDDNERFTQLLVRPAVGYTLNKRMSVWLGYGWTPSLFPEYNNENRIFQQFLIDDTFPGLTMNNRTRLEQRFIDGAGDTSVRLRHMLRLYKPLDGQNRWGLVASDELFWNLNSTPRGPQSGFDQNRVFLGVSRTLDRHARVEVGYLASFVNPPRNAVDRRFDVLAVTMFFTP
jgi:hypothetical protein